MIVYKGRVFSVEVETKRFPSGRQHEMAIVRHPPSVVLIPIDADGRVVLIRQYRAPVDRELWELPAGNVNPGELPDAAAERECEEEIGLVPGRVERLLSLFASPGYCDEEMIFYRASDLGPPPPDSPHKADEDEEIRAQSFTIAEARSMVARGEVLDLKSAFALTLI
jgi:ADP-ribose pyrophosphatase